MGFFQPAIAAGTVPLVLFIDDADAIILCRMLLHDPKGAIGRPVVEADDFQIAINLLFDTAKALVKVSFGIVNWDDNTDQRTIQSHANRFSSCFFAECLISIRQKTVERIRGAVSDGAELTNSIPDSGNLLSVSGEGRISKRASRHLTDTIHDPIAIFAVKHVMSGR